MAGTGHDDFQALAHQYWGAWSEAMTEAMRRSMPGGSGGANPVFGAAGAFPGMPHPGAIPGFGAMPGKGAMPGFGAGPGLGAMPGFGAMRGFGTGALPAWPGGAMAGGGFDDLAQAWRQALGAAGMGGAQAAPDAAGGGGGDVFAHLQGQAQAWYQRMQDVAGGFAGQQPTAREVADTWREALGGDGASALPEMLGALRTRGEEALSAWSTVSAPAMDTLRADAVSWLAVPGFGVGRGHQERLQQLVAAQLEYQHASAAYQALLGKASHGSQAVFERKLGEHSTAGTQLESARALFDLWIDAAEESYAEIALSQEFSDAYGGYVNAQMRVRAAVQRQVEDMTWQLGMPTRTEVDGAYRKIAQLEREVRRLRDAAGGAVALPVRSASGKRAGRAQPGAVGTVEATKVKRPRSAAATSAARDSNDTSEATAAKAKPAKRANAAKATKTAATPRSARTAVRTARTTKTGKTGKTAKTAKTAKVAEKTDKKTDKTPPRAAPVPGKRSNSRRRVVPNGFISAIPASPLPMTPSQAARKTAKGGGRTKARNAPKRKR